MDVHKENGDRYFVATPESQVELELLLDRLDIVSAIGKSIRLHRSELDRLNRQINGVEQEPICAPEGHLFVVHGRKMGGYRDGFQISRFVPGRDHYWELTKEEDFESGFVFLADSIGAEATYNWDDVGSIYAYGPNDEPTKRIRARLDPGKYKVSLMPEGEIPEKVVNPLPQLEVSVDS